MKLADHLARITADPDSAENYLVFADWLQEKGDPWGKLIVLQQQLDERRGDAAIAASIEALIKKHKWMPKYKPDLMRLSWRWGFIHSVRFFDAYGSEDIATPAAAVQKSPMGGLVRRVELFRQGDRTGKAKNEGKTLQALFPTATVEVVRSSELADLKNKKTRVAARYVEVRPEGWKNIEQCENATWIDCRGISELPESLGALPLERLDIDWCGQLTSIPDAVWGNESLGYISMYDCDELGLNMGRVNHLVGGFVRANTPREQRIYEATLFRGGGRANRERLMFAIDNNVAVVRTRAIELLETLIKAPKPALGKGSVVAMIGRFNLDRKTIKKRIEDRGAIAKTTITAQTTHVLLGEAPGGKQHAIGDRAVLLERHLAAKASAKKGAKKAQSGGALNVAKLSKDLRSKKDARIVSAVAALQEAGEVPRDLMAELFCVMADTNLEKLGKGRKNAKKLFAALAPAPLRKAVATHFKTSVLLAGETKVATRLGALEKAAGKHIDMPKLARLFLEDYDCGLKFIIERGDASELRWALERRIKKKRLEITGAELDALPDLSGYDLIEVDATNNHLNAFPVELAAALPKLAVLRLGANYMRRLPKDLSAFVKLVTLELSENRFQAFPKGVVTLPVLEELNLSSDTWGETRITKIPKEIARLKSLRTLRVANGHVPVEVPDEMASMKKLKTFEVTWAGRGKAPAALRKLLPGCKLV